MKNKAAQELHEQVKKLTTKTDKPVPTNPVPPVIGCRKCNRRKEEITEPKVVVTKFNTSKPLSESKPPETGPS